MKKVFYLASGLFIFSITSINAQALKNIGKKIEKTANQIGDKIDEVFDKEKSKNASDSSSKKKTKVGPFKNIPLLENDYKKGSEDLFTDDFSKDVKGSMAQHWTSNGLGTVETVDGFEGKWLRLYDANTYKIKDLYKIPEDFTIEFDLLTLSETKHNFNVNFGFDYIKGVGQHYYLAQQNPINIQASYWFNKFEFNSKELEPEKSSTIDANMSYFVNDIMKVKISIVGERMRTYINEYKILDTEMVDPDTRKYFYIAINNDKNTSSIYLSNFKLSKL